MTAPKTPQALPRRPRRVVIRRPAVDVLAASIAALQGGGVIVPSPSHPELTGTHVEWDISARCERPIEVVQEGEGHYQGWRKRQDVEWQSNRTLTTQVRCRQCPARLRSRQLAWAIRGKQEWKHAETRGLRTWAGTLTFKPSEYFLMLTRTRTRLDAQGIDLASLHPNARFREQLRELGPLVSKYIRSLRKGRKKLQQKRLFFRYFLAAEPHKDGKPHVHVLVHEISYLTPITKRSLEAPWAKHGFSKWALVEEPKHAAYAAKYLGKTSSARVRASKKYGVSEDPLFEVPQKF